MIHAFKNAPQFFMEVAIGAKTFEVRKDDRGGFNPNDILILAEWNGEGETGRYLKARVTYVLKWW